MASESATPIPADEKQRLRDLERHGMVGQPGDEHFDRLVDLAGSILDVPIALISLVSADRQWFLARKGVEIREMPREGAFCAHTIAADDVLVVPDARDDPRFSDHPLVRAEPHIRFYAGAPLRSPEGHNLGSLCVLDRRPRQLNEGQIHQLQLLADLVVRELELRLHSHLCPVTGLPLRSRFLEIADREFERAGRERHPLSLFCFDIDNFRRFNQRWGHHAGDGVLADLARLVRSCLREQDYAGRLGDGEFALLLVDCDAEEALSRAEGLRLAASRMPGIHTHSDVKLQISGGLTCRSEADRHFGDLLLRADRALELARSNGRNQVACLHEGT
jgi:diguanylate cyclase (GGDEF)-like protein